jgi:hypothetical protein
MSVSDYDEELYEDIQDLLERGDLDKGAPAYGVAQQVIHRGYDSLTRMQRGLYDAVVVPALKKRGDELAGTHAANRAV